MLPSTWLGAVLFLVLIAPGALFDLLATRRRARPMETALQEASRIVFASLCCSAVGFLAVGLVRTFRPHWMPSPQALLSQPHGYAVTHYRLLIRAGVLEFVVACAAAGAAHAFLGLRDRSRMRPVSLWHAVFTDDVPAGFAPYACVRVASGATWMGYAAHWTADLEMADRELVLSPPLWVAAPEKSSQPVPAEWSRVVLPGSQIQSITVQYRPSAVQPDAAGRFRRLLGWLGGRPVSVPLPGTPAPAGALGAAGAGAPPLSASAPVAQAPAAQAPAAQAPVPQQPPSRPTPLTPATPAKATRVARKRP